ncbi:MAG: ISAs1 family transposase, partial [Oscillospiraceae bacterium]|nr:ISAs1 family transposase [Oscillospiraceae bacterium]
MDIFGRLQGAMEAVEKESGHKGYWYRMRDILTIMICGLLCSLQTIDDIHEWAKAKPTRELLAEKFGIERIPCRAQMYNILGCVNPEKFGQVFMQWVRDVLCESLQGKTVAIDGKTIRSTGKRTKDGSVLHIASAIISERGLVIGSLECSTKTGEMMAFRELVGMLDLKGTIVVADALHCHKKSAAAIIAAEADYLFVVKKNQKTLREEIALYFQEESAAQYTATERNGGRNEWRTAYVSQDVEWLYGLEKWENLTTIGAIHTEVEKDGQWSREWHYYISSAPLS